MTKEEIEGAIEVCKTIAQDTERDIQEFEGKPFTGRVVAEFNGYQNAMILSLSRILNLVLQHLLEEQDA